MSEKSGQISTGIIFSQVFTGKHRNVSLTLLADPGTGKYTLAKVRQLLYNFGHLIGTLTIDEKSLDDNEQFGKLLTLVHKYCMETVERSKQSNKFRIRFF